VITLINNEYIRYKYKIYFENAYKNIKEIEDLVWENKEYMEFCQYLVVLFSFLIDEQAATMARID